jgi:hypothetical protein
MAITITHPFVSSKPDGEDTSLIQPSNWNDDHAVIGTVDVANGGTGSNSAAGARTNLGLGTLATQDSNNVAITGGSIAGVSITSLDASTTFQDNTDPTKQMQFQLASITGGQTSILTVPDADGTVALLGNKLSDFAATTSAELAGVISDETGSGALVFGTSPTLTTPVLGVATATSINKVAITAPATGATLTVADGKTLTANNSLTLAGTDSTTLTFQGTDTYVGRTTTDTLTNKTITSPAINGTVTTTGLTLPALTLSGNITSSGNPSLNIGTGALTAGSGTFSGVGTFGNASSQNSVFDVVIGTADATTGDNSGLVVVTNATGKGWLGFNKANSTSIPGQITYNHAADSMGIYAGGGDRATFSSTGLSVTGALTLGSAAASTYQYGSKTAGSSYYFGNFGTEANTSAGISKTGQKLLEFYDAGTNALFYGALQTSGGLSSDGLTYLYGNKSSGFAGDATTAGASIMCWNASSGGGETAFINAKGAGSGGGFTWGTWNGSALSNKMTIDASGNLGLGVTPSAWSIVRGFQIASGGALGGNTLGTSPDVYLTANAYYNGSAWKRIQAEGGNHYAAAIDVRGSDGKIVFNQADTGAADSDITWNAAMTLDASGNLIVPAAYSVTTASAANCFVETTGQFKRSTSSLKYKTDIEPLDSAYADLIHQMRPVWYRSKCEGDNKGWSWYGLIAEEVAELDPRLVHWAYPTKIVEDQPATDEVPAVLDDEGNVVEAAIPAREATTKQVPDTDADKVAEGMQYERLTVLLIDVVQRQKKAIESLEARLTALEAK